jgi:hypothetical protein
LVTQWPSSSSLLLPAVATLERAGLVEQPPDLSGYPPAWNLTIYGRQFLAFLQETGEAEPTS